MAGWQYSTVHKVSAEGLCFAKLISIPGPRAVLAKLCIWQGPSQTAGESNCVSPAISPDSLPFSTAARRQAGRQYDNQCPTTKRADSHFSCPPSRARSVVGSGKNTVDSYWPGSVDKTLQEVVSYEG